jgi:tetratricopeptide (TPR) repeat protein
VSPTSYHRSYGGPRLGLPGYGSTFTRYSPSIYRPAYGRYPYYSGYGRYPYYPAYGGYPYHHGSHFSLGFGFYSNCYAYPTYPLAYYPSYYYPLYSPAFIPAYPTTVVLQQPTVAYYPSTATVASAQYASADAYMAGVGSVPEPQVSYAPYADEAAQAAPPEVGVENSMPAYTSPGSSNQGAYYTAPGATTEAPPVSAMPSPAPAPAAPHEPSMMGVPQQPAPTEMPTEPSTGVEAPADLAPTTPQAPQAEVVLPGQSAPDETAKPGQAPDQQGAEQAMPEPSLPVEKLQQLMVSGTQAFSEGRYKEANDLFEQVAKADPQNVDAALACGVAQFASGKYDTSADSIRRGVSLFPPIVDSAFDLRERYKKVADFVDQLGKLEQFVKDNPKHLDAVLVLGFVRHFSNQRDLAQQTFRQLKKESPNDAPLAETFLNSVPPEAANAAGGQGQRSLVVTTQPTASVTTQPAGLDKIRTGPSSPGVLSVTTRPAVMQKIELPEDPAFRGRLSLQGDTPREQSAIDGIIVRLKGTDDDPPKASVNILVGDKPMKVTNFWPGAKVDVQGVSGTTYRLFLTDVDNRTETIGYIIAK